MTGQARRQPKRCPWTGIADPIYTRYHDEEWGVPLTSDAALFEKLVLEGFQAGLSWLTILRKRDSFRQAFHKFDAERIARYGDRDIQRLMSDAGIVRNRAKIEATISNARAFLKLSDGEGLAAVLWGIARETPPTHGVPRGMGDIPNETPASQRISKALKHHGFRFVGPTTIYALMQSAGMVNDHLASCHRREPCARLQKQCKVPT